MRKAAFLFAAFIFLLSSFLSTAASASGEGAATFYNAGNAAFAKGDHSGAVENYLKARDQGADDARLFYNIGCAFLKSGKIGEAIRYFEMARMRDPRDGDIIFNLEFARTRIKDELPEKDSSLIVRIGSLPLRYFTLNELAAAAGGIFLAAFALMGIFWPLRRERRGLTAIVAGLCLLGVSILVAGYAIRQGIDIGGRRAVIGAAELPVKSGPAMENPTLFTVHEGLECRIREVRGTWSFIVIPTGFSGWAPNEALLPIG
jgi:hypothetical protein